MVSPMVTTTSRLLCDGYAADCGVHFARRESDTAKAKARGRVLHYIQRFHEKRRRLNILTMPGVDWTFEKALIGAREHGGGKRYPRYTFITAVESSHAVWTAALVTMPLGFGALITDLPTPTGVTAAVRSKVISRFYCCDVEDYINSDTMYPLDAAWLDFCGPITERRLQAINVLWERRGVKTLVVTSLKARWPRETAQAVKRDGLLSTIVAATPKASVIAEHEYRDGSPMHQVVLRQCLW